MKANIATLKNNLSRYLKSVQAGEEVVVMDRDKPVARLVPFRPATDSKRTGAANAQASASAGLDALVIRGAITHRGDPAAVASWLATHQPAQPGPGSPALSDVFLQMRDEERW